MATLIKKEIGRIEKARKLRRIIVDQINGMQALEHTGFMIDRDTLRLMLNNNPHIKQRWDDLHNRKFRLERLMWRLN